MKRSILVGTALACLFVFLAADTVQAQRRGFNIGSNGINWGTNTWGGNQGWNQSPYGYGYGQPSTYSWPGNYYGNQGYYQGYHQPFSNSGYYNQPWNNGYSQPSYNSGYYYSQPAGFQSQPSFSGAYTSTDNNNQYQSFYSGPGQQQGDGTQALIRVMVPTPNAKVWIENQEMQQQGGTQRVFISPSLQRGSNFVYHVKASWDHNGQQVTRERKIPVQAGQHVTANFVEGERTQQDGQSQTQSGDQRNRSDNQAQPAQSGTRPGSQDQKQTTTPQRPKE